MAAFGVSWCAVHLNFEGSLSLEGFTGLKVRVSEFGHIFVSFLAEQLFLGWSHCSFCCGPLAEQFSKRWYRVNTSKLRALGLVLKRTLQSASVNASRFSARFLSTTTTTIEMSMIGGVMLIVCEVPLLDTFLRRFYESVKPTVWFNSAERMLFASNRTFSKTQKLDLLLLFESIRCLLVLANANSRACIFD